MNSERSVRAFSAWEAMVASVDTPPFSLTAMMGGRGWKCKWTSRVRASAFSTPISRSGVSLAVNYGECNGIMVGDQDGKPCIQIGIHDPQSNHPPGPHPNIYIIDQREGRFWSAVDEAQRN